MSNSPTAEFSRWRAIFWPVHRHELKKLLPMLFILFFLTFNYNILRTMKDTLVMTTGKSAGAEVIPFIKGWVMLPGSILLTWVFTRLSNRLNRETVFYLMMGIFLGYFILFLCFLYPNNGWLHPHEFADRMELVLPEGLLGFISMIRNWTFTTFYVMSELWGNIVLFLLFWAFANHITLLEEAKRFYAILGVATNISGVIAGGLAVQFSQMGYLSFVPYGQTSWDQQLFLTVLLVLASGFAAIYLYRWMHTQVLESEASEVVVDSKEEVVGKMSMKDNFLYLFNSKYLIGIAVITLSYNIIINFVEVLWKSEVKALYPASKDFSLYMSKVTMMIGVIATIVSTFVTGNIVRVFGWTATALLTPVVLLVTSVLFFGAYFFKEGLALYPALTFGLTPVAIAAHLGTVQNFLSRGAKYTVYDATREMAFVPLSNESKLKGKAAIDGVCSRLGKSGGAYIYQILLACLGSLPACAPFIAGILAVIILIWIGTVRTLGKQFTTITANGKLSTKAPVAQTPVLQPN